MKAHYGVRGRTQVAHPATSVDRSGSDDIFAALLQLAGGSNGEAISRFDAPITGGAARTAQGRVDQAGMFLRDIVWSVGIRPESCEVAGIPILRVRA